MYSMKNLTTTLALAALAACSANTTTTDGQNDTPDNTNPDGPVAVDTEFDNIYDLSFTTMVNVGTNVVEDGTLFAWEDTIVLPPNSRNIFLLDVETFIVREGATLDMGLTAPEGEYLVEYRFPYIGGAEVNDWASLRPDGFRAWATTSSVGFTRDSIAPYIDYDFPTDGTYLTDITPGTGGNDAVIETEENNFTRGTIEVIVTNLDDSPIVVAVQAVGIGG